MNDQITIRRANAEDISTIHQLAHTIWPSTYKEIISPPQITYMLDLFYTHGSLSQQFKKHDFLLAMLGEKAVGFASFSRTDEPGIYKLHKLYVDTDIQGKGIGKAIINYILDELRLQQAKALDLNVNRLNKARFFYERLGFVVTREENIDIGQNYFMTDYVMRKEVNPTLHQSTIV